MAGQMPSHCNRSDCANGQAALLVQTGAISVSCEAGWYPSLNRIDSVERAAIEANLGFWGAFMKRVQQRLEEMQIVRNRPYSCADQNAITPFFHKQPSEDAICGFGAVDQAKFGVVAQSLQFGSVTFGKTGVRSKI
jgi:hypothetical protein